MAPSASTPLPLNSSDDAKEGRCLQVTKVVLLAIFLIAISAGLITFNKELIKGGFPYALELVMMHTGMGTLYSMGLYMVKPSLFPSLSDPLRQISIDTSMMLKTMLPIAMLFGGQLVLSNTAYHHSSVAFLQMIKESNVVIVYVFSVIAGLELYNSSAAAVLFLIVVGTFVTIKGELHFSGIGFLLQGTSILCESSKIVLQTIVLQHAGKKLDPLSYVFLVSPVAFVFLGALLFSINFCGGDIPIASWDDIHKMWPILAANCCVAYTLNLASAAFVQMTSGVSTILVGIVKDVMIVMVGIMFGGEEVSRMQGVGFVMQIVLVGTWSAMKTYPEHFENGVMSGFYSLFRQPKPIAVIG